MQNTTAASTGRHTVTGLATGVCLAVAQWLEVPDAAAIPVCGFIGGFIGGAWRRLFGGAEPAPEGPTPLRRP